MFLPFVYTIGIVSLRRPIIGTTYIQLNLSNVTFQIVLFIANSAIFQLYHDENKLIFSEMIMRSALY